MTVELLRWTALLAGRSWLRGALAHATTTGLAAHRIRRQCSMRFRSRCPSCLPHGGQANGRRQRRPRRRGDSRRSGAQKRFGEPGRRALPGQGECALAAPAERGPRDHRDRLHMRRSHGASTLPRTGAPFWASTTRRLGNIRTSSGERQVSLAKSRGPSPSTSTARVATGWFDFITLGVRAHPHRLRPSSVPRGPARHRARRLVGGSHRHRLYAGPQRNAVARGALAF